MGRSEEFDRDGDPSVKKVVSESGPLGLVPVFYIVVAVLIIIAAFFWWLR
jgi:hypothetical protein